jgi:hypothetical protein
MPYPRPCSMCLKSFCTEAAFYSHYLQEAYKDTRCMSTAEMEAYGFCTKGNEYETWGDRHRDFWDSDRHIWSSLYKPAEMFNDMFPRKEIIQTTPRWQRLLEEAFYGTLRGLTAAWKGTDHSKQPRNSKGTGVRRDRDKSIPRDSAWTL